MAAVIEKASFLRRILVVVWSLDRAGYGDDNLTSSESNDMHTGLMILTWFNMINYVCYHTHRHNFYIHTILSFFL
jgi:hypothetical protein